MTLEGFVASCELWLRLAMFILGPLRNALLYVLHNNGVPKQPKDLYNFLNSKKSVLARLKGKGVITQPQWKLLFPVGKNETDSNLFDITLIVLLVEALTSVKPNDGNWRNNKPPVVDISVGAFCIRGMNMRNYLNHFPDITALTNPDFLDAWDNVLFIITGLKYNSSFNVNYLKTVSLNLKDNLLLQALIASNQTRLDCHETKITELEKKNTNTSFKYHTNLSFTTLNEEIEGMRCQLLRNINQSENLEVEIEQLHMSITHDIACLNAEVEELSDRVEELESQNLPHRVEELESQNLPDRVEELETQNLPDRVEELETQNLRQYNGNTSLGIAVQISASRTAVQDNEELKSFLVEAELLCLDSQMKTEIKKVIKESITNILELDEIVVRVHKLQKISREEEYKKFQVKISIHSSQPGVFDDYTDIDEPKSEELKNRIKDSFIKEVNISLGTCKFFFAFSHWKTGSLHIVLSVRKSNHCTFSELEVKILKKAIDGALKSEHKYLENEFGKSVKVITKACTSSNVIDTFNCDTEVVMSTADVLPSDELLSQLNKKIKTMLIENFNLQRNVEVTTPLATLLQRTENQLERLSSASPDVCDIAKIGTIDAYIAKYLHWFVLAVDVTRVPEIDYNKLASVSALNIVSQMIGIDMECLSRRLNITQNFNNEASNERKMKECFEKAENQIYWKKLKYELQQLQRQDIIDEITSKTFCTRGLEKYSKLLKQHYKKELSQWNIPNVFETDTGREYTTKDRNEAYVDLLVDSLDDNFNSNNKGKASPITKTNIEMKDILQEEDQCILIRGVAGIGKTSLINNLVLKWAHGKMINNFDFLLKFTLPSLDTLSDIASMEKLYKLLCPDIYDGFFDDLMENNSSVLLIIDGIDEFAAPTQKLVYDLILQKMPVLRNSKVIVCGRPSALGILQNILPESMELKLVEVSGFSENSINTYIQKFFDGNEEKIQRLQTSLQEVVNLKAMATIPIYLYVLCSVYASKENLGVNTNTKLHVTTCMVFLRDHMSGCKERNHSLDKLSQDEKIIQMIIKLSEISFKASQKERVYLTQEELEKEERDCIREIEQLGIIEKVIGNNGAHVFQFRHAVLQDFFCAVYIFHNGYSIKSNLDYYDEDRVLPLIAGLCGILEKSYCGPNFIKKIVNSIKGPGVPKPSEVLFEGLDSELFLTVFYEYHSVVSETVEKYFFRGNPRMYLTYNHTITQLIFFLKSITECTTNTLFIMFDMRYGKLNNKEISTVLPLLLSPFITTSHLTFFRTNLNDNNIIVESIAQAAKENTIRLQHLGIHDSDLTDDHVKQLKPCIPHLKSLTFVGNYEITPFCMKYISESITQGVERDANKLEELILRSCNLHDDHIKQLQLCILHLKSVDLSYNREITPLSMKYISESITQAVGKDANNLKNLHLSSCNLHDDHIKQLQPCISHLEVLDLSNNDEITSLSIKYISESIKQAVTENTNKLKYLNLRSNNEMCDQQMQQLQDLLRHVRWRRPSTHSLASKISLPRTKHQKLQSVEESTNKLTDLKVERFSRERHDNSQQVQKLQDYTLFKMEKTTQSPTCN